MSSFQHKRVNYRFPCCGTNGKHSLKTLFDKQVLRRVQHFKELWIPPWIKTVYQSRSQRTMATPTAESVFCAYTTC